MKHCTTVFLFLYSVLHYRVMLVRRQSCGNHVKYQFSQLLVFCGAFKNSTFFLSRCCFSYMEHKKPPSAALSFCILCKENNNAPSAGGRQYGFTPGMAENRTRGWTLGVSGRLWDLGHWMLLQLSGSPLEAVCIPHLHRDACHLSRPSDRKCAATLSSFFFYLKNNNSSYCCYQNE